MNHNQKLLQNDQQWEQNVYSYAKQNGIELSKPFHFGLNEKYLDATQNKIMIIGQETNKHPIYQQKETEQERLEEQQKAISYLNNQLNLIKTNPSPFWQLFRKLNKEGYTLCWNNIHPFQKYKNGKKNRVNKEIIDILYQEESILQKQIEIANPNLILLVAGPNYYYTIAKALKINPNQLWKQRPTKTKYLSYLSYNNIPILWTYHPRYLNKIKKRNELIQEIIKISSTIQ